VEFEQYRVRLSNRFAALENVDDDDDDDDDDDEDDVRTYIELGKVLERKNFGPWSLGCCKLK